MSYNLWKAPLPTLKRKRVKKTNNIVLWKSLRLDVALKGVPQGILDSTLRTTETDNFSEAMWLLSMGLVFQSRSDTRSNVLFTPIGNLILHRKKSSILWIPLHSLEPDLGLHREHPVSTERFWQGLSFISNAHVFPYISSMLRLLFVLLWSISKNWHLSLKSL